MSTVCLETDPASKDCEQGPLKMFNLRRISGSTFGPGLKKLLDRYTSAILPIISYACPVWFAGYDERKYTESGKPPGGRCRLSISAKLVNRLESEHNYFLKQLSGAYAMTTGFILLKELAVPTIAVFLTRLVRTYWARVLETRYGGKLLKPGVAYPGQHPYVLAAADAYSKVLQPAKDRLELEKPVDEGARYRKLRRVIKSIADDLVTDPPPPQLCLPLRSPSSRRQAPLHGMSLVGRPEEASEGRRACLLFPGPGHRLPQAGCRLRDPILFARAVRMDGKTPREP